MRVGEVRARGRGVMLDGNAEFRGAFEYLLQVDRVRIALEQLAAGRMAEDADVRVLDGPEHARGHHVGRLVEARVHAGDDDVELRERRVGEVEFAVREDVDLHAGKDMEGGNWRLRNDKE